MSNITRFGTSGGGGGGSLNTLTGNTGGPVGGDGGGNINVVGTLPITVTGNAGTFTETISIAAATTGQMGAIQIATNAQTLTGTATDLAITPDDLSFKLGTQTTNAMLYSLGPTAAFGWTAAGTNGQIVIAATGGIPAFANITSIGGTVAISNGANTINLEAVGSGGLSTIPTDSGTASVSGGAISLLGGNNVSTSGAGSTVTIDVTGTTDHAILSGNASGSLTSLAVGSDGQVLLGATGADAAFATLTSANGNIIFTPGVNSLSIDTSGVVADSFISDSGTATPVLGDLNILGGRNIITSGSANTIVISVNGNTDHSLIVGDSLGSLDSLGVAANGFIPIGSAGANPVLALPTNGNNISWTGGAGTLTANLTGTTNRAVQVGNAGGSLTSLAVGSNGQVLLGSTAANPVFANLTSTGGTISFTTGSGSLNLETSGATASSFATDSGTATPSLGLLTITGGTNIATTGSTNVVTINLDGTTNHAIQVGNAGGSLTSLSVGATNTVLLGVTGLNPTFGTVPNAALTNSSITLNSGNNVTVSGSPISLGGSGTVNLTGTTNHAVQIGNAGGSLTSLGVGATGTYLSGSSGGDPSFVSLGTNTGLTANTVVLANGNSAFTSAGAMVNGTLLIGNTGNPPTVALPTNGNNITWTGGAGTLTANLTGTTDHGVQVGNAGGSLTSLAVGATNTVLLGSTGANPVFGTVSNAALANSSITLNSGNNVTVTGSPISLGGSGTLNLTGTTNHAVQIGNASGSLTSIGLGGNGQLLIGSGGNNPGFNTVTSVNGTITFTPGAGTLDMSTGGTVVRLVHSDSTDATPVGGAFTINGGQNITTVGAGQQLLINVDNCSNHSVQVGKANGSLQSLTVGTAGQVLLGATGADPAFGTVTSTGGTVQFTTGVSALNLEAFWTTTDVTGTSAALVVNRNFVADNAGLVTLTLPTTGALGSIIRVFGNGAGGWKIAQNASQTIRLSATSSTTGTGGSVSSTNRYDSITLACIVTNTGWAVTAFSPGSTFTVV